MVEAHALRNFVGLWMRRAAFCFLGVTSATGMLTLLLIALLLVSGVLEW